MNILYSYFNTFFWGGVCLESWSLEAQNDLWKTQGQSHHSLLKNPLMVSWCLRDKTDYWTWPQRPHLVQPSASSQPHHICPLFPTSLPSGHTAFSPGQVSLWPPPTHTPQGILAHAISSFWNSLINSVILQASAYITILGKLSLITWQGQILYQRLLRHHAPPVIAFVMDIVLLFFFWHRYNYRIKISFPKLEIPWDWDCFCFLSAYNAFL